MGGLVINGLGMGRYPWVRNDTENCIRITFKVAGTDEYRSVEIPPGDIHPFHLAADGKFRADYIEIVKKEEN